MGVALAAAHADRDGAERFRRYSSGGSSSSVSVALVFGLKQMRKNPKGRYYFDYCLLKLPILGALLRKIAVARFTRTLGTLITSGVPILEGLGITARTSGNAVLEEALMKVRKAIEEGRTIVDPLRESRRVSRTW